MKNIDKYESIIIECIRNSIKDLPYVSRLARDMSNYNDYKANPKNDKSIVIDFLFNNKITIAVYVVIYYTDNYTIPQIALEIQQKIKSNLLEFENLQVKSIDVIVTGVLP